MVWQMAKSNNPESAIWLAGIESGIYDKISVVILDLITSLWYQDHHIVCFEDKSIRNCKTWNCTVCLETYTPPIITFVFVHIWNFLMIKYAILEYEYQINLRGPWHFEWKTYVIRVVSQLKRILISWQNKARLIKWNQSQRVLPSLWLGNKSSENFD